MMFFPINTSTCETITCSRCAHLTLQCHTHTLLPCCIRFPAANSQSVVMEELLFIYWSQLADVHTHLQRPNFTILEVPTVGQPDYSASLNTVDKICARWLADIHPGLIRCRFLHFIGGQSRPFFKKKMLSAQTCHRSAVTKDPVQHLGDILDSPPANAYIITFQCQTLVLQTCSITFTKPDHFESIKSLMKMLSPNAAIVSASTHQLWNGSLIDLALPFTYKQIMNEVGFKVMHDHNRNFLTLV